MSNSSPDLIPAEHRRLPRWFKIVIAAIALPVLIAVVIEPGCLCSAPFVVLFLTTMVSTLRTKGRLQICGIGLSVLISVVATAILINVWNLAVASRPIRAAGGHVYTPGDGIADINGPSAVRFVDFTGPAFGDAELGRLVPSLRRFPQLAVLTLVNTHVTDAGLKYLHGMNSLKVLNLLNAPVTADGIAELQRALPGLRISQGP
jgi:hypothetical protein